MNGIPLHPLVVHFAVVLIPLAAFATIAAVFHEPTRRRLGGWLAILGATAAAAGMIAGSFGEQLLESHPEMEATIGNHDNLGSIARIVGLILGMLAVIVWGLFDERVRRIATAKAPWLAAGWVTVAVQIAVVVVAVAAVITMILAGHSGAQAVWVN